MKEQFAWRHYYWYLTNEGIQYLRDFLHLPPEIVPSTLKRQARAETARPRARGKAWFLRILCFISNYFVHGYHVMLSFHLHCSLCWYAVLWQLLSSFAKNMILCCKHTVVHSLNFPFARVWTCWDPRVRYGSIPKSYLTQLNNFELTNKLSLFNRDGISPTRLLRQRCLQTRCSRIW